MLLDGKGGCERGKSRMMPKFFVQTAGRIELPSIDEDCCL